MRKIKIFSGKMLFYVFMSLVAVALAYPLAVDAKSQNIDNGDPRNPSLFEKRFQGKQIVAFFAVDPDIAYQWVPPAFDLKADGANLTGTVKSPRGENEIVDGKIDGDKVSFAVKRTGFQGNEITIKYEGSVSGDELTLTTSFEGMSGGPPGGGGMERPPLVAKRQK